jgi:hypothetical protein
MSTPLQKKGSVALEAETATRNPSSFIEKSEGHLLEN